MRIIAGDLGGRHFESPRGHRTHPMSDKVRGALFNSLGDITGLSVLDAFAGSGALGFEALSRGASRAVLIDNDRTAQATIASNIIGLGLDGRAKLIKAPVASWLASTSEQFDIVLCDPPYDRLQPASLQKLTSSVKPCGILVLSWPGKSEPPNFESFKEVSRHSYGDAQLVFYRA